jgi:hypothetical protein
VALRAVEVMGRGGGVGAALAAVVGKGGRRSLPGGGG